ncbi:MAG TPA: sulfotransferase [Anaerolineae bacterium]|nr:sulfotransferase [Anaerolineae bacterium]HMR64042.1 sulfotransferase [Anaerolineae bacterium]
MQPTYVFIVGLPRTGTKLMMNVLENCQEKACYITPENFFLGRVLRSGVRHKLRSLGDLRQDEQIRRLVDQMYTGQFFGEFWDKLAQGKIKIERRDLLRRLLVSDRSDQAIYLTLLEAYAESLAQRPLVAEEVILGDKSGPHLYRVPTLLAWFPEAKVVHTFRDPRAVLASEHKKLLNKQGRNIAKLEIGGQIWQALFLKLTMPLFSLFVVLYITVAWLYAARLHYKYKKLYPNNYFLSKFEDLVEAPEENVRKLCGFLNIEFHPEMLSPPKIDSSYSKDAGTGFDQATLNRWRSYLKPWMNACLTLLGKKYLKSFGYIR